MNDPEKGVILKENEQDASEQSSSPTASANQQDGNVATQQKQQPRIDDWDGPDDPANPHNWPMWLRGYHAAIPSLFAFAV